MTALKPESAVVIIFYRTEIEWYEKLSLLQVARILGKHKIIALYPRGVHPAGFELLPGHTIRHELDPKWFASRNTYNQLLLNPDFYADFVEYRRILIYQLDAFVFEDQLEDFAALEYDYIGAPWLSGERIQRYNYPYSVQLNKLFTRLNSQTTCYVGNGGFSLRNPVACRQLLIRSGWLEKKLSLNEDGFFSFHGLIDEDFNVAPLEVAIRFAWENDLNTCFDKNHRRLPFGCHAWQKFDNEFLCEIILPQLREFKSVCPDFY